MQQVGDFDGDRKSDILFYNNQTGETTVWLMNRNIHCKLWQSRQYGTRLAGANSAALCGSAFSEKARLFHRYVLVDWLSSTNASIPLTAATQTLPRAAVTVPINGSPIG